MTEQSQEQGEGMAEFLGIVNGALVEPGEQYLAIDFEWLDEKLTSLLFLVSASTSSMASAAGFVEMTLRPLEKPVGRLLMSTFAQRYAAWMIESADPALLSLHLDRFRAAVRAGRAFLDATDSGASRS